MLDHAKTLLRQKRYRESVWGNLHRKEYSKEYSQRPEVKKRKREYMKMFYKINDEYRYKSIMRNKNNPNKKQDDKCRNRLLKIDILSHYGWVCVCCREKQLEFLTIDHINNDGADHRKEIKKSSGFNFYKWLVTNNYPKGFQVLCFNCNMAKGHSENKKCPHNKWRGLN